MIEDGTTGFQFGVSPQQNEFPVGFCFNSVQKKPLP